MHLRTVLRRSRPDGMFGLVWFSFKMKMKVKVMEVNAGGQRELHSIVEGDWSLQSKRSLSMPFFIVWPSESGRMHHHQSCEVTGAGGLG